MSTPSGRRRPTCTSALRVRAKHSLDTSVNILQSTWYNIPEDLNFRSHLYFTVLGSFGWTEKYFKWPCLRYGDPFQVPHKQEMQLRGLKL